MANYNKNIQIFIKDNNIDINYLQNKKEAVLFNKHDINQVTSRWGMYQNEEVTKVSIADIIGKSMHTSKNILIELNSLFDETADEYQKRSLSMLKYNADNIIENLKESFTKDYITLAEIDKGKYIIRDNGMHRCSLIRTHYLNELSKNKDERKLEEINNKYIITALVEKLDIVKTYSSYMLNLYDKDINIEHELDSKYRKTKNVILIDEDGTRKVLNDNQLITYVKENIGNMSQEKLTKKMMKLYVEDGIFKEFINKNFQDTIIEKKIKAFYAKE